MNRVITGVNEPQFAKRFCSMREES